MINIGVGSATQNDLRRMAKRLRTEANGKQIRKDTVKELRDAVKPVQRDVKAAALRLPAKGTSGSTGLRRRIAAATGTQVRLSGRNPGVRIRVARSRMGDQAVLPQRINKGRWRHPVFGTGAWVTQTGKRNWFDNVNRAARPIVRRRVRKVLDGLERRLARG